MRLVAWASRLFQSFLGFDSHFLRPVAVQTILVDRREERQKRYITNTVFNQNLRKRSGVEDFVRSATLGVKHLDHIFFGALPFQQGQW